MKPQRSNETTTLAASHQKQQRTQRRPTTTILSFCRTRTILVVLYVGWIFVLWSLVVQGRRIPGLERLQEEKGRPVSIGEFLATQYVKSLQQQKSQEGSEEPTSKPQPQRSEHPRFKKRRFVSSSTKKKPQVTTNKALDETAADISPTQEESSTQAPSSSSPSEPLTKEQEHDVDVPSSPTESCVNPTTHDEASSTSSFTTATSSASDRTLESWLTPHRELPPLIVNAVRHMLRQLYGFVTYQPPVGIVSMWLLVRFVRNVQQLYTSWAQEDDMDGRTNRSPQQLSNKPQKRRQYISKAWNLDPYDSHYLTSGGVQSVRQRLCLVAVSSTPSVDVPSSTNHSSSTIPSSSTISTLLLEALHVTAQPMTSRLNFIYQLLPLLLQLPPPSAETTTTRSSSSSFPSLSIDADVYRVAYWTVLQVRMMDALLRILRNRLLRSTVRLARTQQHWKRRIQYLEKRRSTLFGTSSQASTSASTTSTSSPSWSWWATFVQWRPLQHQLDKDRYQLANAQAAYQAEVTRLGRIVQVLLQQPPDQDAAELLPIAKAHEEQQQRVSHSWWSTLSPTRYSVRWIADGRGRFSIRQLQSPTASTAGVPMEATAAVVQTLRNNVDSTRQAQAWVQEAQRTICQVLQETMQSSIVEYDDTTALNLDDLERSWCYDDASKPSSASKRSVDDEMRAWNAIIQHCNHVASWRRVGEGKSIRWIDTALVGWSKRLDFLGIPSSFVYYRLAQLVHTKLQPYLPTIRNDAIGILRKMSEILQQRVWVPFQGIVMDILNQGKGMMSAFSLQDEQLSLDRMLHDLGLGDGTPEQRKLGLQQATEQYEDILQKSLFTHLIRGKLVRLMLIQVQQLKVGMLSALDTIDVLMAGNRVHFYLLATVPALAIAYYSTRFFLRSLYNVRAKDIRPVTFAHADMAEYLDGIETILLTSDSNIRPTRPQPVATKGRESLWISPHICLDSKELGEITLLLHRYLLLLDFGSPPFSSSECDHIHEQLRELLFHPGLRVQGETADVLNQQHLLAWFATIQRKHRSLLQNV